MQTPTVNRLPTGPWPLAAVPDMFVIGVLIASFGNRCYGAVVVTAATLLTGVAWILLPRRISGLLVVRRYQMDITILFGLGTVIDMLALVVPPDTRNAVAGDRLEGGHRHRKKGSYDEH